ncbi:MAG: hypothetical protein L0228_05890, partial [Planctomycetes bacterium]|nr:hypothetical protein [Planctomycetota bacterium]
MKTFAFALATVVGLCTLSAPTPALAIWGYIPPHVSKVTYADGTPQNPGAPQNLETSVAVYYSLSTAWYPNGVNEIVELYLECDDGNANFEYVLVDSQQEGPRFTFSTRLTHRFRSLLAAQFPLIFRQTAMHAAESRRTR